MLYGKNRYFRSRAIGDEVYLHVSQNLHHKSVRIDVFLVSDLLYPDHTYTYLVSRLCERGSRNYPSIRDLNARLDELFGTYFLTDTLNLAGNSLLHLSVDIIDSEYCLRFGGNNPLNNACSFLFEVLFEPNLDLDGYPENVLAHEKKIIERDLESMLNDKLDYARNRCIEETGRGTVWALSSPGRFSDIENIDEKIIWEYHKNLILTCPIHVFLNGNLTEREVLMLETSLLQLLPQRQPCGISLKPALKPRSHRKIFEIQSLSQAKYVVSHYTGPVLDMEFYSKLLVFNSLWGGDSHGILFRDLREKRGICYYVDSQVERFSGAIYTIVSCSDGDFDIVSRSIDLALNYIRQQQFPEEFLIQSKALIRSRLISATFDRDSNLRIYLSSIITEHEFELHKLSECVNHVTAHGVSEVANDLAKGVEYFLHDK